MLKGHKVNYDRFSIIASRGTEMKNRVWFSGGELRLLQFWIVPNKDFFY